MIMYAQEFSNTITLKLKNGQKVEMDQRRVRIRENENGLMALSYLAPFFETMDVENFFDDVISGEKLSMDIGGTGEFKVGFRGIVKGKGMDLPQNLDHIILLLQEPKCLDPRENIQTKGFSRFRRRDECPE